MCRYRVTRSYNTCTSIRDDDLFSICFLAHTFFLWIALFAIRIDRYNVLLVHLYMLLKLTNVCLGILSPSRHRMSHFYIPLIFFYPHFTRLHIPVFTRSTKTVVLVQTISIFVCVSSTAHKMKNFRPWGKTFWILRIWIRVHKNFQNFRHIWKPYLGISTRKCGAQKIWEISYHFEITSEGAAAYQLGNTSSRTITEVKQRWARLVLGWETVQVSPECCC